MTVESYLNTYIT